MKLTRPFDHDSDILATLEDDEWVFNIVVSYDDPKQKAFEIIYLDVPITSEEDKKTATVIVSEKHLLETARAIQSLEHTLLKVYEENPEQCTFGPEEANAMMVFRIKRRAVSIVLEDIMDYVEAFMLDRTMEEFGWDGE